MSAYSLEPGSGSPYWRSLQELADTDDFRNQMEHEFPGGIEAPDGMSRRRFLQIMSASIAMTSLAGLPVAGREDRAVRRQYAGHRARHAGPVRHDDADGRHRDAGAGHQLRRPAHQDRRQPRTCAERRRQQRLRAGQRAGPVRPGPQPAGEAAGRAVRHRQRLGRLPGLGPAALCREPAGDGDPDRRHELAGDRVAAAPGCGPRRPHLHARAGVPPERDARPEAGVRHRRHDAAGPRRGRHHRRLRRQLPAGPPDLAAQCQGVRRRAPRRVRAHEPALQLREHLQHHRRHGRPSLSHRGARPRPGRVGPGGGTGAGRASRVAAGRGVCRRRSWRRGAATRPAAPMWPTSRAT
jgi:MoCo/4Fe-4S cofactor protein with predicted Tat translocation signal